MNFSLKMKLYFFCCETLLTNNNSLTDLHIYFPFELAVKNTVPHTVPICTREKRPAIYSYIQLYIYIYIYKYIYTDPVVNGVTITIRCFCSHAQLPERFMFLK